jgi:TolB protein
VRARRPRFALPLIALIGLAGGLSLAVWLAAPRVVERSPAPGADGVAGRAVIWLSFNQPMNRSSVETRLTITPVVPGHVVWDGNRLSFDPDEAWPAGQLIQVTLRAGAASARGLPLISAVQWTFRAGRPRVVYLWPSTSPADLYTRVPQESGPVRLTQTAFGIQDYSVGRHGELIAYAALRSDGGADLRLLNPFTGDDRLAYTCPQGRACIAPSLSVDGRWLAFETAVMRPGPSGRPQPGETQVWLLDLSGAGSARAVGPSDRVTAQPAWSPSGWLEYFDSSLNALTLVDPNAGAQAAPLMQVPSGLGDIGSWSPDGAYLAFAELVFPQETALPTVSASSAESLPVFYSHIQRLAIARGTLDDLTGGGAGLVEDASPAYSPDGAWIALGRKYLEPARWTLGRQLWLMRADGSDARPMTNEPSFNHSAFAWSPDSKTLAFMRFDESDFNMPSEIWWMDIERGDAQQLVVGGYSPAWIP